MQAREEVNTLFDLARLRARLGPDQPAFTFLSDGESEGGRLTYGELDRQAVQIASRLQAVVGAPRLRFGLPEPPPRVLLLFDPGLDYIAAFFGAVYAGMIPVPAYPPDLMRVERTLHRLQAVAVDCQASVILGTRASLGLIGGLLEKALNGTVVLTTDDHAAWGDDPWTPPAGAANSTAFLQYTSGSTSNPRGVMVSHANLLYQMQLMNATWARNCPHTGERGVVGVSWLPLYHDLGLVGGILTPFHAGRHMVLMSPLSFIQRPIRWLLAMSRYRAIATGGPNFAYDLCVSKFRPQDADGLDLSCWRVALSGAETVRSETLDRFAATFAPHGFDPTCWLPSYGLAEATLGVTGWEDIPRSPRVDFSLADLEHHRAREAAPGERARRLVGCGHPLSGTEVRIVDPQSRKPLEDGAVGEVWVRSPGVALGYWNRPAETEATFNAHLAEGEIGPFMRTGDLGFFHDKILYLTGRLKETMIFWGRNVYPQDVESTVAGCHESLRQNGGAAFAIEHGGQEQLVVVQEVHRPGKLDLANLASLVRQAVLAAHQVPMYSLVLIRPGTLPKTSSGKIQRGEARRKFLAEELDVIARWRFAGEVNGQGHANGPLPDEQVIQDWLRRRIAQAISVPVNQVAVDEPLGHYVMDSITLTSIARDLELWLGRSVAPAVVFDSPTLSCLARRLTDPASYVARVDSLSESELDRALEVLLQESPSAPPAKQVE